MSVAGCITIAITVAIMAFFIGTAVGVAIERRPTPPDPRKQCPWVGCGYPTADTPLTYYENSPDGRSITWARAEKCEGCDHWIIWNWSDRRFVRSVEPGASPPKPEPAP